MADKDVMVLPTEEKFKHDIEAINKFQQIAHQNMREGHDFGVIPGTKKPTLLKPGAEKIIKLLGLSDQYEIIDRQEDWAKPFFRYLLKCILKTTSGIIVSEGVGECNSMESKYRWRWVYPSELPKHLQGDTAEKERHKLVSKRVQTKKGWATQYRLENDDIYSQVNTLLKMAKKRSQIDAALSAGRLSEVFTQDIEDMGEVIEGEAKVVEEPKAEAPPPETEVIGEKEYSFDAQWLVDSLKAVKWTETTVKSYLKNIYHIETEGTVLEVVERLTDEQRDAFFGEVKKQLEIVMRDRGR